VVSTIPEKDTNNTFPFMGRTIEKSPFYVKVQKTTTQCSIRPASGSKRGYARFYEPESIAGFEEIIRIQPRLNPGYMLQEDTRLVNEINLTG
jgi:hypothetical protein